MGKIKISDCGAFVTLFGLFQLFREKFMALLAKKNTGGCRKIFGLKSFLGTRK